MSIWIIWKYCFPKAQHTLVLTTDGHLYATGKGDFGRLGRGDTADEIEFHESLGPGVGVEVGRPADQLFLGDNDVDM